MQIGLSCTTSATAASDAALAEDLGFDYVACGEHLYFHGPTTNPFVHLAAAAAATRRIRLLTSVSLLPLYPLPLYAKLATTLDQVSGGRLELGLGAGGEFAPEFEAAGVDVRTRFLRLEKGIPLLRRMLVGDAVTVRDEFTTVRGLSLDPAAATVSGPRLWLGGRGPRSSMRAGRYADVWMPYMVTPDGLARSLERVGDAAQEAGRDRAAVTGAVFLWLHVGADKARSRRVAVRTVSRAYSQDFDPLADRYLVFGSSTEVARRLIDYAEAGAATAVVHVASDDSERRSVVARFAAEVLPELKAHFG